MSVPRLPDDTTALLHLIDQGDLDAACNELFKRLRPRLARLVGRQLQFFRIVSTRAEVDDFVQELCLALLKAFRNAKVPHDSKNFFEFAGLILRHQLITQAEKWRLRGPLLPLAATDDSNAANTAPADSSSLDPAAKAQQEEFNTAVFDAVEQLESLQSKIVTRHLYFGQSFTEIGAGLDIPDYKAKRLWHQACAILAPLLKKFFPEGLADDE